MSVFELKSRLADIAGIENLTMQAIGGRQMFSIGGKVIGTPLDATDEDVETAIRTAFASPDIVTVIPMAQGSSEKPQEKPLPAPAPGSFAASLKAMLADARAGVERARADGMTKVSDAVAKMQEAQTAIANVTGSMSKTIHDEADAVLAELGQISNDLAGEA